MTTAELNADIAGLSALQDFSFTYQQIAAMRMRKIRANVVANRDFYNALLEVYHATSKMYVQVFKKPHRNDTNGKKVAVLLSSNTGLYGDIVRRVFDLFVLSHATDDTALVITGRLGKKWIDSLALGKAYVYYDLPDSTAHLDTYVHDIYREVKDYQEVVVYHGLFGSIINQKATQTTVTKNLLPENSEADKTLSFIFEPSIDEVLATFEKQLLYLFFDQTVSEGNLAKYGSRMVSLDQSTRNIAKNLTLTKATLTKSKYMRQNKKQLEQVCAMLFRG